MPRANSIALLPDRMHRICVMLPVVFALFLLVAPGEVSCAGGTPAIVVPPDRSTVESRTITMVVRAGTGVDEVGISVNGAKPLVRAASPDRTHVCCSGIALVPGANTIRVTARTAGKETASSEVTVFYRADLSPFDSAPASFSRHVYHGSAVEAQQCRPCHRTDFGAGQEPRTPEESPCHACHRHTVGSCRNAHGPAAVWSCAVCHTGKTGTGSGGSLRADDTSCTLCHDDVMHQWKTSNYQHGPAEGGKCTTCHNPHGSDHDAFLRLPTVELCSACHEETVSRPHVISTPGGGGIPPFSVPTRSDRHGTSPVLPATIPTPAPSLFF